MPPVRLQLGAEHPQPQHIEKNVQDSGVHKRIRYHLEYPAVDDVGRYQSQNDGQRPADLRGRSFQQFEEQVDRGIDQDQPLHGLGEGRETQRESSSTHKTVVSSQMPVASGGWTPYA